MMQSEHDCDDEILDDGGGASADDGVFDTGVGALQDALMNAAFRQHLDAAIAASNQALGAACALVDREQRVHALYTAYMHNVGALVHACLQRAVPHVDAAHLAAVILTRPAEVTDDVHELLASLADAHAFVAFVSEMGAQ